MNKKIICVFSVLLLAFTIRAHNASADFTQYTMVGAINDTEVNEKTVFDLNETPYLYMKLPETGDVFTGSFWRDPDGSIFYISTSHLDPDSDLISDSGSGSISGLERWITLADWDSVKKMGKWEVNSNYFYTSGNTGFGTASFTVTPEPLAMVLFLIGGAPIAVSLYRKKKRAVTV